MRGRFVTFEGIEGVGKSTQHAFAAEHLRRRGIEPVVTREPGGTPLAEQLRTLVLGPQHAPIGATEELLIMFAARASHVADVVAPALAEGRWVLCDRFTDTTEAYQGGGRGIDPAWIRQLAAIAHPGLAPDLTFLFDAPPSLALGRLAGRTRSHDRIEGENTQFFGRVREAYLAIAAREPERVRIIDAAQAEETVARAVGDALDGLLAGGRF